MKLVPIGSIEPSTYNPRTADKERLAVLELSLRKLGWLLPIYATKEGEIMSGHQRHLVATRMGLTHVPVEFTQSLDLDTRKAVNVAFNRGTNDLGFADTPKTMKDALRRVRLDEIAARVPDKDITAEGLARCCFAKPVATSKLVKANLGRWNRYALNITKSLAKKGIIMPVVCTPDLVVVNGIGRVQFAAGEKAESVPVVTITPEERDLADTMLNLLSMDFSLHERYADLLRYNSFRRVRRTRDDLGRGFRFAYLKRYKADAEIAKAASADRWKKLHGTTILDFGAGHLTETELLRGIGCRVVPFEPFHIIDGKDEIDRAASRRICSEFLDAIEGGVRFSSVFCSSVLNSVPFEADRLHIVQILAACARDGATAYGFASSTKENEWRQKSGPEILNVKRAKLVSFRLDYEDGIGVGEITSKPKVQKYHSPREFYRLWKSAFAKVEIGEFGANVSAIAKEPLPVDPTRLRDALRFEFDLPYPDGSTMGLADRAVSVFSKRLGVRL